MSSEVELADSNVRHHRESSDADTTAANDRIRESTGAAVADFQENRASETSSSGRTAIDEPQTSRNGLGAEPEDPNGGGLAKAGMLGAAAPGQGGEAKRYLANQGGRQPAGWEGVEVPSKHGFWSPAIASERKQAFKVC